MRLVICLFALISVILFSIVKGYQTPEIFNTSTIGTHLFMRNETNMGQQDLRQPTNKEDQTTIEPSLVLRNKNITESQLLKKIGLKNNEPRDIFSSLFTQSELRDRVLMEDFSNATTPPEDNSPNPYKDVVNMPLESDEVLNVHLQQNPERSDKVKSFYKNLANHTMESKKSNVGSLRKTVRKIMPYESYDLEPDQNPVFVFNETVESLTEAIPTIHGLNASTIVFEEIRDESDIIYANVSIKIHDLGNTQEKSIDQPQLQTDAPEITTLPENEETVTETIQETITETTTPYVTNCSAYREVFKPHFMKCETIDQIDVVDVIYAYSPMCNRYPRVRTKNFSDDGNGEKMLRSVGKPFNPSLDMFGNFDYHLNNLLRLYLEGEVYLFELSLSNLKTEEGKIVDTYINYVLRFFELPIEFTVFDRVVNDVFIPFRNKVHCIKFDDEKKRYCKDCLGIHDEMACCSLTFYNYRHKKRNEVAIKTGVRYVRRFTYFAPLSKDVLEYKNSCFDRVEYDGFCKGFYDSVEHHQIILPGY